ncbi:MAG: DNA polymerase III subunit beta, partial [Thermoguttaceae bacterium]|nr:DNA polymerase III subunit beta [Thermoguttaceae bacterium]
MKLRCEREKFFQLFNLASSVTTSRREVKPILQNVKMIAQCNPSRLVILASDMAVSIRLELEQNVEVDEEGQTILPTEITKRILSAGTDAMMEFETDGTETFITIGKSRYRFPTQYAGEFPDVPAFEETVYHQVSAPVMHELIRRTIFATENQNSRYALQGVLFEFTDNRIAAISTDGRRLACQESVAEVVGDHFSENSSIFSPQSLALFDKSLVGNEFVRIAVSQNKASLQCGMTTIHCQLVEGRFPRWRNIIPDTAGKNCVDLIVSAFMATLGQGQVSTSKNDPGTTMHFSVGNL